MVEDDEEVRILEREVLQASGYTVLEAADGPAALRLAGEHAGPIHLLLTDVFMPGMNGLEVADRVVALRPEIRTVYVSGYTEEAVTHHARLDPGAEFLRKPFLPRTLVRTVREELDRR